jgi:hypothetical protein
MILRLKDDQDASGESGHRCLNPNLWNFRMDKMQSAFRECFQTLVQACAAAARRVARVHGLHGRYLACVPVFLRLNDFRDESKKWLVFKIITKLK